MTGRGWVPGKPAGVAPAPLIFIGSLGVLLGLAGCATGPHPALALAKKDLKCEDKLELHEIYPQKVRVEGCGRDATYVKGCDSYGVDANCAWVKHQPSP